MKKMVIFTGLATLSACASASDPVPNSLAPATVTAGSGMTGTVPTTANNGDTVAITIAGTPLAGVIRNSIYDRGGFRAFSSYAVFNGSIVFSNLGHSGETSTGDMTASVAASSRNSPTGFDRAATISRINPTILPTGGTADFSGQYIGSIGGNVYELSRVTGNVALNADFGGSTISGSITNRVLDGPFIQNGIAGDVTLAPAVIDAAGAFSGTTTGGTPSTGGPFSTAGSWTGLIGGTSGNQVAGIVQITNYNVFFGQSAEETGVFLAE